jgi:tRNA 2-thiouridine synthesizing protein A
MTVTAPTTADEIVDARGLSCPMPIVKTATLFRGLAPGTTVEVLATDPGSVKDFGAWTRSTGNELIAFTQEGSVFRFLIRKS